jgi:hypothetical protein
MARKNNDDSAGALNQEFNLNEVEGHTESTWTPRSYSVQTDTGAITGAQASIYTRATAGLDQSLRLLDGLYPLLPGKEGSDTVTVRALVRDQLTALVSELGTQGAPNVPRVDELLVLLDGSLGQLRQVLGLDEKNVNTVDDEQNLTNFMIIVDYVNGLRANWNAA